MRGRVLGVMGAGLAMMLVFYSGSAAAEETARQMCYEYPNSNYVCPGAKTPSACVIFTGSPVCVGVRIHITCWEDISPALVRQVQEILEPTPEPEPEEPPKDPGCYVSVDDGAAQGCEAFTPDQEEAACTLLGENIDTTKYCLPVILSGALAPGCRIDV